MRVRPRRSSCPEHSEPTRDPSTLRSRFTVAGRPSGRRIHAPGSAKEDRMDYGLFTMPSHPPERNLYDGHRWDLQQLRWADELGFSEAWIGEHHTAPWEPHPAPDLLVAQALLQTSRMRIGPGGFLMPYHHPAELAHRVAMRDPLRPHIKPFQKPYPPIGVAGVSKGSDTLKLAGERGFWPMSLNLNPTYVGSHWDAVEQGAARTGRTPKRSEWRLVREIFIADTDAEAMRLSAGGMMGRMMKEYFLPLLASFQFTEFLKHKPD